MSNSLVYTRNNFRFIAVGAIEECFQGLHQVGFNANENYGHFNVALRFFRWENCYAFFWDGGYLRVTKAAFEMTVRRARKHGVPVFLEDDKREFKFVAQLI